jgi:hypothetical protein
VTPQLVGIAAAPDPGWTSAPQRQLPLGAPWRHTRTQCASSPTSRLIRTTLDAQRASARLDVPARFSCADANQLRQVLDEAAGLLDDDARRRDAATPGYLLGSMLLPRPPASCAAGPKPPWTASSTAPPRGPNRRSLPPSSSPRPTASGYGKRPPAAGTLNPRDSGRPDGEATVSAEPPSPTPPPARPIWPVPASPTTPAHSNASRGAVYLLHFGQRYVHAGHYTGKPASSGLLKALQQLNDGEFGELGRMWLAGSRPHPGNRPVLADRRRGRTPPVRSGSRAGQAVASWWSHAGRCRRRASGATATRTRVAPLHRLAVDHRTADGLQFLQLLLRPHLRGMVKLDERAGTAEADRERPRVAPGPQWGWRQGVPAGSASCRRRDPPRLLRRARLSGAR